MGSFESVEYKPGTSARAYVARGPSSGPESGPGVLVLHPWWGLNQDVLDYADRLSGEGFTVLAPDMFEGRIETTVEGAEDASGSADQEKVGAIVATAVDRLAELVGAGTPMAVLGFSFGAAWAIWVPTRRPLLRATIVYYGTWNGSVIKGASVPVLGHFAENDPYEPSESVDEFEAMLRDASRESEIYRYPGTGHWFAEQSRPDAYDAAAAGLAFDRTIAFLRARLAS